MYLSRLTLNLGNRQVLTALNNAYLMHQMIWRAFPHREEGGTKRVLFRVEPLEYGRPAIVLVQSWLEPDWSELEAQEYLTAEKKFFDLKVHPGKIFRFRLKANPTKRLPAKKPGVDGPRVSLLKESEQKSWLERKALENGFEIEEFIALNQGTQAGQKLKTKMDIKNFSVNFEGVLTVTDSDLFTQGVKNGLGSGKAFGFGLLSLAPAGLPVSKGKEAT